MLHFKTNALVHPCITNTVPMFDSFINRICIDAMCSLFCWGCAVIRKTGYIQDRGIQMKELLDAVERSSKANAEVS